jgi:hypothetical protein
MTEPTVTPIHSPRRAPALVLIAAVLIAAAVVDRSGRSSARPLIASRPLMPTAAPASALSSTWYCPVAVDNGQVPAAGVILVSNPGRTTLTGQVTLIPNAGATVKVPITVGPGSRQLVREVQYTHEAWVAAEVDFDGGLGTVEQATVGAFGDSAMACASAASDQWYFAEGNTTKDATFVLALFNPFPEDAIADLTFSTEQGRVVPDAFQGVVVPAGGLTVLNVGDHVRRREEISTSINVRSGRVVAGKLQLQNGSGRKGVAVTLGAPAPGPTWYFPDGFFSDGVVERYHVYNPGNREAQVDLDLTLEQGAAEPFSLTVPPQGRVTLVTSSESRIPKGVAHAVTARSTNGVPVVVERTIDAASPASRVGYTDVLGAQSTASRWLLGAGGPTEATDEWVVVLNTGSKAVHVSITALADGQLLAVEGLQGVTVPAGRRMAFRMGDHIKRADLPMIIDGDGQVVVERGLFRVGGIGMSQSIAIPER